MATLVTGADTPLGYAVARALLAAGQEVVALVAPEPRGPVCACLVATDGPHAGERFALGVGPAPRFVGRSAAHGEGGVCLGRGSHLLWRWKLAVGFHGCLTPLADGPPRAVRPAGPWRELRVRVLASTQF